MAYDTVLPFPPGKTANADSKLTLADDLFKEYLGRKYQVVDPECGTKQLVTYMVVQADAALTSPASKLCRFATTDDIDWGRKVAGLSTTQGEVAFPADPNLSGNVSQYDAFYIVVEGLTPIYRSATGGTITAGDAVCSNGDGTIDETAPGAADFVVGRATETSSTTSELVKVYVAGGMVGGEGA